MTIEIAYRLVQLRKQKNLSQEELAAQLGISRQAVSKWERAEASPDTDNLILLARLYGVSLDELLNTDAKDDDIRESVSTAIQEEWKPTEEEVVRMVRDAWRDQSSAETAPAGAGLGADPFYAEPPRAPEPPFTEAYTPEQCACAPEYGQDFPEKLPKGKLGKTIGIGLGVCVAIAVGLFFFTRLFSIITPLICIGFLVAAGLLKKKYHKLNGAYPILCTMFYLFLGFCFGQWHPGWMIFLTVPLYYTLF